MIDAPVALDSRFWNKVRKGAPGECWAWTASLNGAGYGQFFVKTGKAPQRAHRLAFVDAYGAFDPSLVVDHLCRNRACVNPEHMEAVTHRENILRGTGASARNARKVECHLGHPLDGVGRRGSRFCRECKRMDDLKYRTKHRDKVHAMGRRWVAANEEKVRAYKAKWYQDNKARLKAQA